MAREVSDNGRRSWVRIKVGFFDSVGTVVLIFALLRFAGYSLLCFLHEIILHYFFNPFATTRTSKLWCGS